MDLEHWNIGAWNYRAGNCGQFYSLLDGWMDAIGNILSFSLKNFVNIKRRSIEDEGIVVGESG